MGRCRDSDIWSDSFSATHCRMWHRDKLGRVIAALDCIAECNCHDICKYVQFKPDQEIHVQETYRGHEWSGENCMIWLAFLVLECVIVLLVCNLGAILQRQFMLNIKFDRQDFLKMVGGWLMLRWLCCQSVKGKIWKFFFIASCMEMLSFATRNLLTYTIPRFK